MPSILEQEIMQQPQVIQTLITRETPHVKEILREISGRFHYVVIAARGTSDNAARYAQYLFGAHNQLQVALATPSLFSIYELPPNLKGALVIGISQSGKSPDIVSVVAEGKRQGCPTLAITNDPASPLAETAGMVIDLGAGKEQAVAATKTYTASLGALALFSALLENNSQNIAALEGIPECMQQTITGIQPLLPHVERYRYMDRLAVIGRGYNYATAFEIALKVKELTRTVAEPYSSADIRHGPIATIANGFPVLLVAPGGAVTADLADLLTTLKRRRAELMIISDLPEFLSQAQFGLPITSCIPEWLSPLVAVLPGQLIGWKLAQVKGMDPDQPEGLTKVTETL